MQEVLSMDEKHEVQLAKLLLTTMERLDALNESLLLEEQKTFFELMSSIKSESVVKDYFTSVHKLLIAMNQYRHMFLEYLQRIDSILWKNEK